LDHPTEVRPRVASRQRAGGRCSSVSNELVGSALDELYRAFFVRLVRRVTWRYGLSKDDAREVVHDAFVLALVKIDPEGNPQSWIYSVVDRLAANWKRKESRHAQLLARWSAPAAAPDEPTVDEEGG
jgi:DNA-directed RNA polymerase specialized sigma24 family protein